MEALIYNIHFAPYKGCRVQVKGLKMNANDLPAPPVAIVVAALFGLAATRRAARIAFPAIILLTGCGQPEEPAPPPVTASNQNTAGNVGDDADAFETRAAAALKRLAEKHGADGQWLASLARSVGVKLKDLEDGEKKLYSIDFQRFTRTTKNVAFRAHVGDIRETADGLRVSWSQDQSHEMSLYFDVSGSADQIDAILKARPRLLDEFIIVVKIDKLIRREVAIEAKVIADGTDDPDVDMTLSDIPLGFLFTGKLIDLELVPQEIHPSPGEVAAKR